MLSQSAVTPSGAISLPGVAMDWNAACGAVLVHLHQVRSEFHREPIGI